MYGAGHVRVLDVSRSGDYEWLQRLPSPQARKDEVLSARMVAHFQANRQVYGTRRLTACLAHEGEQVSRRRIGRLIAEQALRVRTRRKFTPPINSSHGQAVAPHGLRRQFEVAPPESAYVGDITDIWTAAGWRYLAVVIDWFSRAVVGWSMHRWLKAERVTQALQMALHRHRPCPGLIMHTDRGSQYGADRDVQMLRHPGIEGSQGRVILCPDK